MAEKKFGWRRDNIFAAPNTPSEDQPDHKPNDAPATAEPAKETVTEPPKTPAGPMPAPKP